jgi:hypothetical protein
MPEAYLVDSPGDFVAFVQACRYQLPEICAVINTLANTQSCY